MKPIALTLLLLTLATCTAKAENPTTNAPAATVAIRPADTRDTPPKTHTLCRRHRHLRTRKNPRERD